MTEEVTGVNRNPGIRPDPGGAPGSGTKQTVKNETAQVADTAKGGAQNVAGTAKSEVKRTTGEAQRQARDLLRQSQSELTDQAGAQQERLAGGLRTFSSQLGQMVDGAEQDGMAAHLVRWASEKAEGAGQWLQQREPGQVVDEVKQFARRRPGVFLLAAAGLGVAVGRVARSMRDEAMENNEDSPQSGGM